MITYEQLDSGRWSRAFRSSEEIRILQDRRPAANVPPKPRHSSEEELWGSVFPSTSPLPPAASQRYGIKRSNSRLETNPRSLPFPVVLRKMVPAANRSRLLVPLLEERQEMVQSSARSPDSFGTMIKLFPISEEMDPNPTGAPTPGRVSPPSSPMLLPGIDRGVFPGAYSRKSISRR